MEINRRLDLKKAFIILYCLCFAIYLLIGLTPAEATNTDASTEISIPSIGLHSDVTTLHLGTKGLDTPDSIVGRFSQNHNKTLLIGHSSTIFSNLNEVQVGDEVYYDELYYNIVEIKTVAKSDVKMREILSESKNDTIIIMTCAGELYDNGDASHRLIITATR